MVKNLDLRASLSIFLRTALLGVVCGTLFTATQPRIVRINDKRVDAVPTGVMIVLENKDVPGVIGDVASLLGKKGVNIAQMTWGRREAGGAEARVVINIDGDIDEASIQGIAELADVLSIRAIRL